MTCERFSWTSTSGKEIAGYHWARPDAEQVVVLCHGFGEHIGRYEEMASFFREQYRSAVLGNDHLGFGRSEGIRGHVSRIDLLLDETEHLLQRAEALYPGKPVLLYGHSMGGMLVLRYALRRSLYGTLGILSSAPWLRLAFEPPAWKIRLGQWMRKIWPSLQQPSGLDADGLSTDPEVVRAYEEDPLVHRWITPATGLGAMQAGEDLMRYEQGMPLPTLIMHGLEDPITSLPASKAFAERNAQVRFKEWPGLRHEIHHEPNKREVWTFAADWFEEVKALSRARG